MPTQTFDDKNSLIVVVVRDGTDRCEIGDFVTVKVGFQAVDLIVMQKHRMRNLCVITLSRLG
jgi:hypothetical protein